VLQAVQTVKSVTENDLQLGSKATQILQLSQYKNPLEHLLH
jgi:hypothetical protein